MLARGVSELDFEIAPSISQRSAGRTVAVRIGSNISSLQAQRRLGDATSSVATSLARLSSGQRITRASDDAAGVAIADTLRTRRQVYDRGTKNINDGISLLTIADSALGELAGLTTRILELAEQAANGSYSQNQRQALDNEAQRLREEFFRISRSTQFNGLNLFDGSVQGLRIQAGFGLDGSVASALGGRLGQGTFGGSSSMVGGGSSFVTADFDGDGNIDMVSSAGDFLRGRGDGTFQNATTFATGGPISSVAAGDFNNDGFLDVVTALGTNTLSLYLNNGAGGFQAATSITTGGNAMTVTAVDANRDGRMDIVTGNDNAGTDTISILLGNGTGGFGAATNVSISAGASPLEFGQGDFNGDGVTDLALAGSGGLWTFTGNGSGGFGAATAVAGLSGGFSGLGPQMSVADLNGDGLSDIVAANAFAGEADIFIRSANGASFNAPSQANLSSLLFGIDSLSTADLNGDGALDIVASSFFGLGSSIVLGDGRGNFGSERSVSEYYFAIGTADLNGDGVVDLVGVEGGVSTQLGTTRDGVNPILPFSLRTLADARQAIAPITRKLEELNKQRGVIGAFQSRLTSAALSATSQSDGFRAAESRIRDVDVAQESSRLSSAQIQQQAATAVLAQANLQPNLALQLLRAP